MPIKRRDFESRPNALLAIVGFVLFPVPTPAVMIVEATKQKPRRKKTIAPVKSSKIVEFVPEVIEQAPLVKRSKRG